LNKKKNWNRVKTKRGMLYVPRERDKINKFLDDYFAGGLLSEMSAKGLKAIFRRKKIICLYIWYI